MQMPACLPASWLWHQMFGTHVWERMVAFGIIAIVVGTSDRHNYYPSVLPLIHLRMLYHSLAGKQGAGDNHLFRKKTLNLHRFEQQVSKKNSAPNGKCTIQWLRSIPFF